MWINYTHTHVQIILTWELNGAVLEMQGANGRNTGRERNWHTRETIRAKLLPENRLLFMCMFISESCSARSSSSLLPDHVWCCERALRLTSHPVKAPKNMEPWFNFIYFVFWCAMPNVCVSALVLVLCMTIAVRAGSDRVINTRAPDDRRS